MKRGKSSRSLKLLNKIQGNFCLLTIISYLIVILCALMAEYLPGPWHSLARDFLWGKLLLKGRRELRLWWIFEISWFTDRSNVIPLVLEKKSTFEPMPKAIECHKAWISKLLYTNNNYIIWGFTHVDFDLLQITNHMLFIRHCIKSSTVSFGPFCFSSD